MTFKLGLTGSIGMGKSTTAQLFVDRGYGLWDADAAVHRLYGVGGAAVGEFRKSLPEAVENNQISRKILKEMINRDKTVLKTIEAIVHPLVRADREAVFANATQDIMVFDIPLLFETKSQSEFDAVACVHVSDAEQTRRVMARGTMTRDQFEMIRAKQMSIAEKLALSDYQIETTTIDYAAHQVDAIIADIKTRTAHA